MRTFHYLFALVSIGILFYSCSTVETVKKSEGEGSKKVFDASYDKVWNAAIKACSQGEISIVNFNKDNGQISAKTQVRATSWGENISVWVRKIDTQKTEVEVVSKKAGPALLFHYDWEKPILENIGKDL